MRAFMSSARHYDLCTCVQNAHYYGFACESPNRAIAEARAILAETEPPFLGYRLAADGKTLLMPSGHANYPHGYAPPDARAILADALTAFLSMEIS